ncbi:MAG: hypothetical protein JSU80_06970 [Deltaproteobacteria bacterium]|nr:MAG: hypothetical protein JSU80_06970 [Deltaproteobacteria bacterium]
MSHLSSTDKPKMRELLAVAIISASVLGLQVALMRTLSISRWHHFAYLVVGLALLGFGASGTWLGLFSYRLLPRFLPWCRGLTLGLAISATLSFRLAEILPLNIQYVLFSGEQLFYLLCYQALIFLPFLFAGVLIGLALIRFASSVHLVYGANLLGSGAGPVMALGLMMWLPPARIIQAAGLLIWASVFLWRGRAEDKYLWRQVAIPLLVGLLLVLDLTALSMPMRIDPHKMLAELQRWEQQDDAKHLLTRHSPRGRLDVFSSPRLHYTLFAGLTATTLPPAQALLLVDGNTAGPIFHINDQAEAAILDHTPMSVSYRILPGAKVLLLGETSGVNIWLAKRYGASQITVVMENPQILDLFRGPLAGLGGQSLKGSDLKIQVASPRHYLEYSQERFDIIQVVSAESMAAGVSSLLSLHENYLFTVEGLARCLKRLTPIGLLTITRGLQSPPRDNIKILATLVEAMEKVGIPKPSDYIAQLRNHLAVCTLAARQPFQPLQFQALVRISDKLWLDIDTLAGFDPNSRKPFNQLLGPPGSKASFFQLAANKIFSAEREAFIKDWAYNVRPATDDRPYFFDFFRWRSLPKFMESYGNLWFQRLELGYVILVISLVQIVAAAVLLLLLPLFIWTRQRTTPFSGALIYFLLIGLGFLALEMSLMQRLTLLMGDPLLAAAAVLSGFLFFSGCGSLCSQRWARSPLKAIAVSGLAIALLAPLVLFLSQSLLGLVAAWNTAGRFFFALSLLAPLAFLMGWPFPAGMSLLEGSSPALLAWAWGINGFASVAAAPLTVLLAMSLGFRLVFALAITAYLLAVVFGLRVWRAGIH